MTKIESLWLKNWAKKLAELGMLIFVLQFFFQYIRDIKRVSSTYTLFSSAHYVLLETFYNSLELVPILSFGAAILVNLQWQRQGYFLRALLDGMSHQKWRYFFFKMMMILLCTAVPCFIAMKSVVFDHRIQRGLLLNTTPSPKSDELYPVNERWIYRKTAEKEYLFDKNQKALLSIFDDSQMQLLERWKTHYTAMNIGLDLTRWPERYAMWQEAVSSQEKLKIEVAFYRDFFFFFSLVLGTIFIEIDRSCIKIESKKTQRAEKMSFKIMAFVFLYWSLKIFPLMMKYFSFPLLVSLYLISLLGLIIFTKPVIQ